MGYTESLTKYTGNFIDELAASGLEHVVISPGSRSTPLAILFADHPQIKQWVIIDERSAAFFALGLAKETRRPVALVCTSGTAAANYYPAIIEAHYSRVPLLVLTADRPHELRDVGAPQAIEQIKMYGEYVKWFHEMALPDETESMLAYVRGRAARAFYMAQEGNPGPVQLNFPFREPLMPDLTLENRWGSHRQTSFLTAQDGIKRLSDDQLNRLLQLCKDKQRGVIVCGPQQAGKDLTAVVELAKQWQLPILADPLSQLRTGSHEKDGIVEGYDAFLKNADIRANLQADFIIRFGAMPVSKSYLFYINEQQDIPQFVIEDHRGHREPTGNRTEMIFADANQLCIDLIARTNTWKRSTEWLEQWKAVNGITKKHVTRNDDSKLTEGSAVRALMEMIPDGSGLYVGNSMAVRDVDTFLMTMNKTVRIHANRGANGIDGMVSSAIGAAAGTMDRMTLLIGDLSFYHDLNGLLNAKHFDLSITILLIHNNGGGIFSFLPQSADQTHFEALFGTPLDIEFEQAITMYGGKHQKVSHVHELRDALEAGYHHKGLSVVEVNTDRQENATWHQELWANIHQDIKHSGVNQ